MDLNKGVSVEEAKGLKLQETWLPVTPAKPTATRAAVDERWANKNWFDAAGIKLQAEFVQGRPSVPSFLSSTSANFHSWGSSALSEPTRKRPWHSLTFTDLLGLDSTTSGASASAQRLDLPSPDGANNKFQSNPANVVMEHSNRSSQDPRYGFPVPYTSAASANAVSTCNQAPQSTSNTQRGMCRPYMRSGRQHSRLLLEAMLNGNTSSQFAPLTPEKQNQQHDLVNNSGVHVNEAHSSKESCLEVPCMEKSSRVGSSSVALSTPSKENQVGENQVVDRMSAPPKENDQTEEENGIDLNKTPQKSKKKKKKHRPRVVTEKKPRAPKSAAKTNETQEVKRKNVRKGTPSTDVARETKEATRFSAPRSCKRSLNFDLKSQTVESLEPEKETFQNDTDLNNRLLDTAFHPTCDAKQMLSEYISLPEGSTQPTRREILRNNLVFMGKDKWKHQEEICQGNVLGNHEDGTAPRLQTSIYLESENKFNGNKQPVSIESRRETLSKRAHPETLDGGRRSFDALSSHPRWNTKKVKDGMLLDSKNWGMLFPEIHKKRRTMTAAGKSHGTTIVNGQREVTGHYKCKKNLTTSQGNSQYCDIGTQLGNGNAALTNECCPLLLPIDGVHPMQQIPGQPRCRATSDKMKSSELIMAIRQPKMMTRKRTKGHTRVRDLATLTSFAQCNNLQGRKCNRSSSSANNRVNLTKRKYSRKGSNGNSFSRTHDTRVQELATNGPRLYSAKPRGSKKSAHKLNSPIDELIQKLSHLSISALSIMPSSNEQTALVPFKGDDRMVPYVDPIKKRRPRAKVELDSETERVWKLLMGKEASEGVEGIAADNEKSWEEERRVFNGRADSFIARMHLIQGDRRFSKWNGSVLDSVVGVFLTQNVSDHLSSSAFMSLAARFPVKHTSNDKRCQDKETKIYVEEPETEVLELDSANLHEKSEPVISQGSHGSITLHEIDCTKDKETRNSVWPSEVSTGADGCSSGITREEFLMYQNAPNIKSSISRAEIGCPSFAEAEDGRMIEGESSGVSPQNSLKSPLFQVAGENVTPEKGIATWSEADRRALEDVVSSKSPDNSSINKIEEIVRSSSDSNSEEDPFTICKEDPSTICKPNGPSGCTSFMELLQTTMFQECYSSANGRLSIDLNSSIQSESDKMSNLDFPSLPEILHSPSIILNNNCCLQATNKEFLEVHCPAIISSETIEQSTPLDTQATIAGFPCPSLNNQSVDSNISLEKEFCLEKQLNSWGKSLSEIDQTCRHDGSQSTEPKIHDASCQRRDNEKQQVGSTSSKFSGETVDAVKGSVLFEQCSTKSGDPEFLTKEQAYSASTSKEKIGKASKQNGKPSKEKEKVIDWDDLRKEAYKKCGERERNSDTMDSVDWEAVRCADVNVIADCIKDRGMNNVLAGRIKDFLNRLVREHESLDLEWLRDAPPDKIKDYLLSVRGLGLKSVECVRLLTLHHLAFPVDTNVGRIAVRLGWVPLQPLPESVQLHLLEMYPIQESIQKYLWPRLCTLDQRTLYELHYQMITFGKVFCTKNKPNCNACPMKGECKHFASAFVSSRCALPGPVEKGIVNSTVPTTPIKSQTVSINSTFLLPAQEKGSVNSAIPNHTKAMGTNTMPPPLEVNMQSEANMQSETGTIFTEPIIEVPASPECQYNEMPESDIEDAFWEDPDEIPVIKLNMENLATNLENYMQESNIELQDNGMSKCLVALTPEAASIPMPKLKNQGRLRTEHQVYELPDSHPLLEGVEKRVPGEVCPYLLAIWTPGETAQSTQPPQRCCDLQMSGNNLCTAETCYSCNSIRESNSQTVRGTLLIPCKTAMRGSFPLNGTYFQVNEVFADHDSSLNPINVPRTWIWNLSRRTVYFGASIPVIFRGQSMEQIQRCFWRGYVCVRGFDRKTRAPRPLIARLHFAASKAATTKGKSKAKAKSKSKSHE